MVSSKSLLTEKVLTPARREILEWLGEHRFATSSQLRRELTPNKSRTYILNELSRLRELGMVRGFALNPELGKVSEFYWQLTKPGALQAGVKYGSHFTRRPTPELLRFLSLQLSLEQEVEYAEWLLVKPVALSPTRPLPDITPQYHILAQVIETLARRDIERARQMGQLDRQQLIDFEDGEHLRSIPKQVNDYVVYQPERMSAIVLILCPPGIGNKFWQRRVTKYGRLTKLISIYGVFETEELAKGWAGQIFKAGLKTVAVDKIYELLKVFENG